MYKTGKLDPEAGSVTRARMNFLKQRLEEAEGSGDTRLISEDEIFELEGLMKKFRKEDIEFKVQEQPERKLTDEEIKELKDLTDNDDFDLAEGGIIKLAKGGRIGFVQGGLGSLGLLGKENFDNENYVDKIITDNLKDIKNYFRSKFSVEIADQKFNEYLESLTYEDMYDTFNEETGNFSGMVESFIGADGERKQIPYPPDKNIDAVGILEALNIDKETVGVNPDYNINDRKPFDPRFFQNENFTGIDDFYVEGREV